MKVKITKIEPVDNPVVRTALKEEYICGEEQAQDVSLFNGYWVTGILEYPIEVGKSVRLLRDSRNGVKKLGVFCTSEVLDISVDSEETIFATKNSWYKIEYNYNEQ